MTPINNPVYFIHIHHLKKEFHLHNYHYGTQSNECIAIICIHITAISTLGLFTQNYDFIVIVNSQ